MEGEFRLFLALSALLGWMALELARVVALLTKNKTWSYILRGVIGLGVWFGGGLLGVLLFGVVVFLSKKKSWRWYVIMGVSLLLMEVYAFSQEKIWWGLRTVVEHLMWQWPKLGGIWAVMVFFRPWYAGYMMVLMLWGIYLVYGKYPATFWYRVACAPLVRWMLVFVGLTVALGIGWYMKWHWLTRLAAGPWTALLVFFAGRGLTVSRLRIIPGRRLPFWLGVGMVMLVMLWLGEDFLTVIWVLAGVGLGSVWFMREKETR